MEQEWFGSSRFPEKPIFFSAHTHTRIYMQLDLNILHPNLEFLYKLIETIPCGLLFGIQLLFSLNFIQKSHAKENNNNRKEINQEKKKIRVFQLVGTF